jgi:hypothetical protein
LEWRRVNRAACDALPSGAIISSEKGFVYEAAEKRLRRNSGTNRKAMEKLR